jgi:hypothetical protein
VNKLTIALIIAQNGLRTAASLLSAGAAKDEASGAKAADKKEADKLKKKSSKAKKLAQVLSAADAGITSYLSEPE